MTPAFNPEVEAYSVSTSNATNTITATASAGTQISMKLNGSTVVENGSSATWQDGENTLVITVTNGANNATYTITVTKTA